MPDFMDFRRDAETPMQGPSVEVSGVAWCVTAWHEESQLEGLDLVHWYLYATFPETQRVWVDAEFSFVKADGSKLSFGRIAKELLGSTTLPRRAGFAIAKVTPILLPLGNTFFQCHLVPQYLHEDGTMPMTVDFRIFKDVHSEPHEVWDTRLVVDDHTVYVSRPVSRLHGHAKQCALFLAFHFSSTVLQY